MDQVGVNIRLGDGDADPNHGQPLKPWDADELLGCAYCRKARAYALAGMQDTAEEIREKAERCFDRAEEVYERYLFALEEKK